MKTLSRQDLLSAMQGRPDIEEIRHLPQPVLLHLHVLGLVYSLDQRGSFPPPPEWTRRMRPRRKFGPSA